MPVFDGVGRLALSEFSCMAYGMDRAWITSQAINPMDFSTAECLIGLIRMRPHRFVNARPTADTAYRADHLPLRTSIRRSNRP